jgi:hypothetical protein
MRALKRSPAIPAGLVRIPGSGPVAVADPDPIQAVLSRRSWLVFTYRPTALFSLKSSRATSTVGKSLLIPTPYAAKMAFVDASLRHGLTSDPDGLIRMLSKIQLRIGVPDHVCVTGTIQRVLQETRADERRKDSSLPFYRSTIAMREVVSYGGRLALAFERTSCVESLADLLMRTAPAIN